MQMFLQMKSQTLRILLKGRVMCVCVFIYIVCSLCVCVCVCVCVLVCYIIVAITTDREECSYGVMSLTCYW